MFCFPKVRTYLFNAAGWCVSIFLALSTVYGCYKTVRKGNLEPFTRAESILYGTFARWAWSLAVAWVIFACHRGLGGKCNMVIDSDNCQLIEASGFKRGWMTFLLLLLLLLLLLFFFFFFWGGGGGWAYPKAVVWILGFLYWEERVCIYGSWGGGGLKIPFPGENVAQTTASDPNFAQMPFLVSHCND